MKEPEMPTDRRLRRPVARPGAALRLFCLPHAGGSAGLYRAWPALLPPEIEPVLVCPPGREDRLDEPFPADLPALVADLAQAVAPLLDRPWAVFGHSMGATVAQELALHLTGAGHRGPVHLFASAREAPQYRHGGTVHLLDDDALCAELLRLGGSARELLAIPEIRPLVLPAVREDHRLIEHHTAAPRGLLDCPVTALVGDRDTELTAEEAAGWREWTTGSFELLTFPGGHFYLSDQPGAVVDAVLAGLAASGPDAGHLIANENHCE
ncbi:alpha/beta fold hydrolase [Kitasatospora paracochleata]|uniref:Surfactin synthase thioesterase subunit n=1 Tax=Kitasatospora paracochleata TaxID=58354 RepID=A0ABT1IWF0_9ACTN|nr:alpha/beta fold hydrolase [Kitasatospora paracochleata]MCP2309465.1 surfactin synthase thioesterase subunit [Kitasatospora paracochleata]